MKILQKESNLILMYFRPDTTYQYGFFKQLEYQKRLTEEMKRKQEQGFMQLQGEVLELAIEGWLVAQFPLDSIDEIKKGVNGADCLQVVNTREPINCRTIQILPVFVDRKI